MKAINKIPTHKTAQTSLERNLTVSSKLQQLKLHLKWKVGTGGGRNLFPLHGVLLNSCFDIKLPKFNTKSIHIYNINFERLSRSLISLSLIRFINYNRFRVVSDRYKNTHTRIFFSTIPLFESEVKKMIPLFEKGDKKIK